MNIRLPENVKTIINSLYACGFEAYAVGGCVRDTVIGRTPEDWDITTSATPSDIKKIFKRTVDTGIEHGTVTVLLGGKAYEVTTYRIDGKYSDGRHPESVSFTPDLKEDLLRRDFTVNAMAYNDEKGLVDLFGGMEDIEKRIIRAVGEPEKRFSEDALRMLRAVRFSAQLGFEIEPETAKAVKKLSGTLSLISSERIYAELVKLLMSDEPGKIRTAYELGLTKVFLPEFDVCMRTRQNNRHHIYSVGEHIVKAVEYSHKDKVIRIALLLHDIGKPACMTTDESGEDHFKGHAEAGVEMARAILRRLHSDNKTIDDVCTLIKHHDWRMKPEPSHVRRGLSEVGKELFPALLEVQRADSAAHVPSGLKEMFDRIDGVEKCYLEILARDECVSINDLAINGKDVLSLGISPGPEVGRVLRAALEDVLETPSHNNKEYLIDLAKQEIQDHSGGVYGS